MAQTQTIKAGTKIEVLQAYGRTEPATICRWTKANGPIKNHAGPTNPGWHIVMFADGGKICMHETGFRVVS